MKKSAIRQLAGVLAVVLVITGIGEAGLAIAEAKTPQKITMNKQTVLVKVNRKVRVRVTGVQPAGASKKVIYMVSNRKIATVSRHGVIKGKRAGITTVMAVSRKNRRTSAMIKVIVAKCVPKRVKISKKSLSLTAGSSKKLKVVVVPKKTKTSNKKGVWSTASQEIAQVSSKGIVTAVGVGKTTITFKTLNGKKAECKVTVTENSPVAPSPTPTAEPTTSPAVSAAAVTTSVPEAAPAAVYTLKQDSSHFLRSLWRLKHLLALGEKEC